MALSDLELAVRMVNDFALLPQPIKEYLLVCFKEKSIKNNNKKYKGGFKTKRAIELSQRIIDMVESAGRPVIAAEVAKYIGCVKSTAHEHLSAITRGSTGILRKKRGREFIYFKEGDK